MPAEIDRDVKDFSGNNADQCSLRLLNLVVNTTQDIADGTGMIILYKFRTDACL